MPAWTAASLSCDSFWVVTMTMGSSSLVNHLRTARGQFDPADIGHVQIGEDQVGLGAAYLFDRFGWEFKQNGFTTQVVQHAAVDVQDHLGVVDGEDLQCPPLLFTGAVFDRGSHFIFAMTFQQFTEMGSDIVVGLAAEVLDGILAEQILLDQIHKDCVAFGIHDGSG